MFESMSHFTLANWNIEWARPRSKRGRFIIEFLHNSSSDIVCLTETYAGFLEQGHIIEADADYGYVDTEERRKVILRSKVPWRDVSRGKDHPFPPGRLIAGTTETAFGSIRVVGICIPWRDAHVRTGRRDCEPWEEHLKYLSALKGFLGASEEPMIVIGDFNQRIPRSRQPAELYDALLDCFGSDFDFPTRDLTDARGSRAIDHLAVSKHFRAGPLSVLPRIAEDGTRLSDHFGFVTDLRRAEG